MAKSFHVLYVAEAEDDLRRMRMFDARRVLEETEALLSTRPDTKSRRIKLLEGLIPPWDEVGQVWQLRVGDFRVFYDIDEERREVVVRAIRRKGNLRTEEIV